MVDCNGFIRTPDYNCTVLNLVYSLKFQLTLIIPQYCILYREMVVFLNDFWYAFKPSVEYRWQVFLVRNCLGTLTVTTYLLSIHWENCKSNPKCSLMFWREQLRLIAALMIKSARCVCMCVLILMKRDVTEVWFERHIILNSKAIWFEHSVKKLSHTKITCFFL